MPAHSDERESWVRGAAPRITRIVEITSSRLFILQEIDVRFGNGKTRTFERWRERCPHSVLMVAVNQEQEVILVWEFAAGVGRRVLRLPSGRVGRSESAVSAARRELGEELGLDSGCHRIIHRFHNEPGHSDAFTDVVLLTDLRPDPLTGDEPEPLQQFAWPLSEIHVLIEQRAITDARTIAALWLAELDLQSTGVVEFASSRTAAQTRELM